jgi:hypothetical protein
MHIEEHRDCRSATVLTSGGKRRNQQDERCIRNCKVRMDGGKLILRKSLQS